MFTLPHIIAPKFTSQLLIRKCRTHVKHQREYLKLRIAVLMHGTTGEHLLTFPVTCSNTWKKSMLLSFAAWRCLCNLRWTPHKKCWWVAKTNTSKLLICWLKNSYRISTFRNCYAADHVKKSDLQRKSKTAEVFMKWLSQGIPLICGNLGTSKHFWILWSSHE